MFGKVFRTVRRGTPIRARDMTRERKEVQRLGGLSVDAPLRIDQGPTGPTIVLEESLLRFALFRITATIGPRDPTTGECGHGTGTMYQQILIPGTPYQHGVKLPASPTAADVLPLENETDQAINPHAVDKDVYAVHDGLRWKVVIELGCS